MPFLTLAAVAAKPQVLTSTVTTPGGKKLHIRPLEPRDAGKMADFLQYLSPETRRVSPFPSYDIFTAQNMCEAIGQYDKLRLIVENSASIVGLLEFSFAIMKTDIARYAEYNIQLDEETDCRFGPTLADAYQGKGFGTLVFPFVKETARKFGKKRIILWGGVLVDNPRAIRFYEKNGFRQLGTFVYPGLGESLDMILDL